MHQAPSIQLSSGKYIPERFLHSLSTQCTIPQHEVVCCTSSYISYITYISFGSVVMLRHSLVVGCGSPPYEMRMGSCQTIWGFVPVELLPSQCRALPIISLLSSVPLWKGTALPLVFVKEKYTCPSLLTLYPGYFEIQNVFNYLNTILQMLFETLNELLPSSTADTFSASLICH